MINDDKIKVLFIAGSGRCGSTILHDILGEIDGISAIGELRYVWGRGFINNSLCGCRVPFRECKFWRAVVCEAFGGIGHVDAQGMYRLTEGFRIYHLPLTLIPHVRKRLASRLSEYLQKLEKLYQAIHVTTDSKVIVDSSKDPQYGYVLQMIPKVELYVVHLIRDPRAVAYSWSRKRLFEPGATNPEYMDQYNSIRSSLQWNARNAVIEMYLRRVPERYMVLRYEDFIGKPRDSVERILNLLGETAVNLRFVTENTVEISNPNHSVFGNPSRFRTGAVKLETDHEWETKMRRLHKVAVTTLTWPLLLKYGYR